MAQRRTHDLLGAICGCRRSVWLLSYFPRKKNPSNSVIDHASQVGRPWLH
jgi:hypothetical protein